MGAAEFDPPGEDIPARLCFEPSPPDAEAADALSADLERVLGTTRSDTPAFPEAGYHGEEARAYGVIVDALGGREPWKVRGQNISEAAILALACPRGVSEATWKGVVSHVVREVRYFGAADAWLGDAGHFREMFRDQVIFRYVFLDTLNSTYLKLPSGKSVDLAFDVMMGLAVKAMSAAGTEGKVAAAGVDALWKITKATQADYKATLSATIAQMKGALGEQFSLQTDTVERAHARITGDWGLLEAFGQVVYDGGLVWPASLKALRVAASLAFHTGALAQTVRLIDPRPFVCMHPHKAGKGHKRKFDPASGDYHLYTSEGTGKHAGWYLEYFLAYHSFPGVKEAPKELQRKLFGLHQSSDWDPELALPAGFYTRDGDPVRKPWGLKTEYHDVIGEGPPAT